ncbi:MULTISPECIES: mechanosensitive ion channel family protein [Marinobacter]|uniref:Small-conductance mechanosensitive channel n=1 Tax=Marinobacter xiaoshiensis TaxID=3073652 RepID=A0ABU2HE15_9GAMM|nr:MULTISPECIES: mechanosensitive ion channel domain-containing protein [unclassified Marinobacter]MDS1309282.1 mechanosensitive ion channel [Marinobacter sp. F60267]
MIDDLGIKSAFASITSQALLKALLVIIIASLVIVAVQKVLPRVAEKLGGKPRLYLLASVPLLRLLIIFATITVVVPILVEPSFENMVAIFGALALALGFAFKDYANSLIAGIVTLYEMPYRPGDWIEVDGQYGVVRAINTRAAEIVTPDDTVVIIPHNKLWNSLIANGNDGTDNLMCTADFYLEANHDVSQVRDLLRDVAFTSPRTKTWQPVLVIVFNKPWGMHYRVKAYPFDPKEQFQFVSELTARGSAELARQNVKFVSVPVVAD